MFRKIVIGVCGFVLAAAVSIPAFADQSIGYQQYFNEGVKAYKKHDDQKAIRCFKIAQIFDPSDEETSRYIDILEQKGVTLELPVPTGPADESVGYKYYLARGVEAYQDHEISQAVHYFNLAIIFNPDSKEADRYLQLLSQKVSFPEANQLRHLTAAAQPVIEQPVAEYPVAEQPNVKQPVVEKPVVEQTVAEQPAVEQPAAEQPAAKQPVAEQLVAEQPVVQQPVGQQPVVQQSVIAQPQVQAPVQPILPLGQPQPVPVISQPILYVPEIKPKQPAETLSIYQITNNGKIKPKLQIAYHSSVILEGKNIRRFLVVDDAFIGIRIIDQDHIEIDALRIGTTFFHIWDDSGRHTFYVEVVFPPYVNAAGNGQQMNGVQHSKPFKVTYTNDWDTYYSGKNIPDLKRQSYEFEQSLAVTGETPYGFFDTSGDYIDFNSFSQFDTYTIGLSQIPVEGTSNFNLRGFDALRYLSPLTLPGTRLRGAFADVDLLGDTLGLSVSHGQEQAPLGFLTVNETQFTDSYIDAFKLTLFPKSNNDQYSFNYATAYGQDRQRYLSDHVYSVEGQHKFNEFLTMNAEEGSDSSHDASLASLKWQEGTFNTGLHFRNIDKDYTTISTLPAYQGETSLDWTTDADLKEFTESTFVEAYRDRLDLNPNDSGAYNFDANGQLRKNFTPSFWSDTDFNYVDTPGELSPMSSLGVDERLSKSFGIWNSLRGTVFGGGGYQNSHSPGSDITNYDREDVTTGIQLPLTRQISSYVNYEYDWLNQPGAGGYSNPGVLNAGFEYQRQINSKLTFNGQVDYHDELGVKTSNSSYLSGEESVIITTGFNYTPMPDMNIFGDCDASKVLSHIGNPSYDDFEVHLGMRITFGGATYWDPLGTVSGIVFKDRNQNGKFGPGDVGVPDVKIKVGDKVVVTDKKGRYRVQIRAKGVDVVPVLDSIPGGLLFSTPQTLNVRVFQGRVSHADFGLLSQTGIYGLVFVDRSGTGVPNEGDKFIGKVIVTLDGKFSQKSDTHGAFYFRNVVPGDHVISININTLALNMVPLIKLKNKINVAEGTNYMFNIPVQIKEAQDEQD